MAFALPLAMVATAIGAGVTAYGQYQAGQAQAAQYGFQADTSRKLASIAAKNANWDIASGEVKAQQAGLVSAASLGRITSSAGARNVAINTGSTADVLKSQIALGVENQKIQRADAAHAAYGEEVQAAERAATGGAYDVASRTSVTTGDISALGSVVSGAGSVAGKWYQLGQITPESSNAYTG